MSSVCPLCLDELRIGARWLYACGHGVHTACLAPMARSRPPCSMCREPWSEDQGAATFEQCCQMLGIDLDVVTIEPVVSCGSDFLGAIMLSSGHGSHCTRWGGYRVCDRLLRQAYALVQQHAEWWRLGMLFLPVGGPCVFARPYSAASSSLSQRHALPQDVRL